MACAQQEGVINEEISSPVLSFLVRAFRVLLSTCRSSRELRIAALLWRWSSHDFTWGLIFWIEGRIQSQGWSLSKPQRLTSLWASQVEPGVCKSSAASSIIAVESSRASEENVMDETEKSAGTTAMVAGLIAAVRLARVDSEELTKRSPRVRSAIHDSVSIARMVIEEAKARQ